MVTKIIIIIIIKTENISSADVLLKEELCTRCDDYD